MILERQFVANMFEKPELIKRTTLSVASLSDNIAKIGLKFLLNEEKVTRDSFTKCYTEYESLLKTQNIDSLTDFEDYIFGTYPEDREFDWMYVENVLKNNHLKRRYTELLEKAGSEIEDVSLDTAISNLDMAMRNLEKDNNKEVAIIKADTFLDIYDRDTLEIEEAKNSNKPTYYTLFHPVLKKYLRMKLGWNINLISKTGGGKSIVGAELLLHLVMDYDQRALLVTDENSDSVILTYLHCAYFGISYHKVEDREIDLSEHINLLTDKEYKKYKRVFNNIDVIELPSIPLMDVRSMLKTAQNNDNPYSFVMLDSFDEINSDSNIPEFDRYDINAKQVEKIAKAFDVILLVTNQLQTTSYSTSIENIPQLCTHFSKTIVKKSFLSLLLMNEYKKDGDDIKECGFRMKINKNRSGGQGVIYEVTKDYNNCRLIPSNTEIGEKIGVDF